MPLPGESVAFAAPLPDGVYKGLPADLASRVSSRPGAFWLDSADAEPGTEAWSYLGWQPGRVISWRGNPVGETENPLDLLRREVGNSVVENEANEVDGAPEFCGGWFSQLSYDLGRSIEHIPECTTDDLGFPMLYLAWHPVVLAFSHRQERWWVTGLVDRKSSASERAAWLVRQASTGLTSLAEGGTIALQDEPVRGAPRIHSNVSRDEYQEAVSRALAYIAAGDIYQVNLSQRFQTDWSASAFELYLRLRQASPARYGVFACLGGGRSVCSISPELFLRRRGREILTRPIKGTRRRGTTAPEDARLRAELAGCAKERAELNMIVDLERNDLGRVCAFGSVQVLSDGEVEEHPTVFHRVASVRGRLREEIDAADLLKAAFPGGSITGAPKIRAMAIIEELEPTRRGPYCGSLGWLGADGNLELNIAIRTALVEEGVGKVWYQAGGGIVADSSPAREYEESLEKAAAFFRALSRNGCMGSLQDLGLEGRREGSRGQARQVEDLGRGPRE